MGSFLGSALVLRIPSHTLRPLVLVLLVLVAMVLTFRRTPRPTHGEVPSGHGRGVTAAIALAIGVYDGFFGPGTGTFLIMAFVFLLGESMVRATGDAKVVNFASNLAAVIVFAHRGAILWPLALPMAVAQLLGGIVGSRIAVRGGERLIRKVVLFVVLALVARLSLDLYMGS